ncbi:MAG: sialidase family protein [Candidatus Kapabacteria bacterium]|nr:sialidase family protein [Candidatus Kapabacteria bacterium]
MRCLAPCLIVAVALLFASCTKEGDATTPPTIPGDVPMTRIASLPSAGGNVTSLDFLDASTIAAVIDAKIYTVPIAGGTPTLRYDNAAYTRLVVGGGGEIYALTDDALWVISAISSTPMKTTLTIRTAQTLNVYLSVGPNGQCYVRVLSYPSVIRIYTSTDKGTTWTTMPLPTSYSYGGGLCFGASANEIYVCGPTSFHASTDAGTTWTTSPAPIPNYGGELLHRANGDIICYVPGGSGLSVSRNKGASFTSVLPFNLTPYIWKLIEGADGLLYAALARYVMTGGEKPLEIMRSEDGGGTWKHLYYSLGHDLAVRSQQVIVGQSGYGAGGVAVSTDNGATFVTNGISTIKNVTSFGFDGNGALIIAADFALFQQTSSGWLSLGPPMNATNITTSPQGTIYVVTPSDSYSSTDNGRTWTTITMPAVIHGNIGSVGTPVVLGMKNGNALVSVTTYRDDLFPAVHTNGRTVIITPTGTATRASVNGNFVKVIQDADGVLYGATDNFRTAQRSTDGGTSWTEVPKGTLAFAIDGQNKFIAYGELGSYSVGKIGNDALSTLTLSGFPLQSNAIKQARFDKQNHLWLLGGDQLH